MGAAAADHPVDLASIGRPAGGRHLLRGRVMHADIGHQLGDRGADRGPVRLVIVARPYQGLLQGAQSFFVPQLGQPGPPQQRPQGRIAQRRPIELAEMGVAAAVFQQHGIADVVQRGAVFPRGQRPECGAGDGVEAHAVSFRRIGEGRVALSMAYSLTRPPPAGSGPQALEN